jgi:DNA-binding protein WhiA
MSFSSEIKSQLSSLETKKSCCKENIERGNNFDVSIQNCEKDTGCFLRGLFLKCGSISAPGRNFMLSFTLPDEEYASYIEEMLNSVDLPPKRSVRRGKPVLYYKASESIEDVLAFMGGAKAALDIINVKIMSEVRNTANRLCNAETANLDRIARAAAEQCEAIKIIQKYGVMQSLAPELRECAELRLANPDMSLNELLLQLHGSVSKSGLNHRFRKLVQIAETLQNNQ